MERRDRSLEALAKLTYVDSLDNEQRVESLIKWSKDYLSDIDFSKDIGLTISEMTIFSELFYKNINFAKRHKNSLRVELEDNNNIKKFLQ